MGGLLREFGGYCNCHRNARNADLSHHSQDNLNEIAERLNNRPRKVLDFETPNEVFAKLVADAQLCCASA
jgi:IS30 family transposase